VVTLDQLEPRFGRHERDDDGREIWRPVSTLAEANGILFLCPVCFRANGGPIGTHAVSVTFADRGVPDDLGSRNSQGKASRWVVEGNTVADLTLRPSIHLAGPGCGWHGFITAGAVTV
jgi:hypothetical protein